jgi:hypothetical protein
MALTDKLTAIANAIREKSGKTAALTLEQMPGEILNLSSGTLVPGAAEDYVRTEVHEVASKVNNLLDGEYKNDNCIVAICISDSHYYPDTATKNGVWSAVNAIKGLTYAIPVDFIAHLGDVAHEDQNNQTTNELQIARMDEVLRYLKECSINTIPLFVAIGNHDTSVYITSDNKTDIMSAEYLYNNFTSLANFDNKAVMSSDTSGGGYCYRDFEDKKLRVYLLNTGERTVAEKNADVDNTTETQRAWVAASLLELNTKSDASDWGIVVLCHYPLDYGSNKNVSDLFEAYVDGKSITLKSTAYNFSGKNAARFLAQFHGHVHNFLVDRLYYGAVSSRTNGTPTSQYNAYRIGTPNAQYNRENYYYNTDAASTNGTLWGIKFFEGDFSDKGASARASKTPGTANDTSFVVNLINTTKEKIHSFCYGAGQDRVVGIGAVKFYSVSRTLAGVTTDGTTLSVEEGLPLSEIITLNSGYDMKTITVTMGGVDISSSAVSIVNGTYKISIAQVTGNVVITAKAQARPNFVNLVPLALNTNGTDYYVDGDGYDDGMYITASATLSGREGYVSTGYISVPLGTKTIRIAGDDISFNDTYCRIAFYDASFGLIDRDPFPATNMGNGDYNGTIVEESTTAKTWIIGDTTKVPSVYHATYMRVSAKGKGENLIITVNEEISYGADVTPVKMCSITQNLTQVSSSNSTSTLTAGQSFTTTLTATSGYVMQTPSITMNGADITAWAYNSGVVNIPSVVGNVVISASAYKNINNLLAKSTDTDGSIYNGVGYKAGTYLSNGAVGTREGVYTSGYIPVKAG